MTARCVQVLLYTCGRWYEVKRLSEVCKIVGVTRRTLQEYDKVGLLHPSDKTEAGYWLYDENAIQQLIAIQVFVKCGYKRKKIKSILEMPSQDLLGEFDRLITILEEKKNRIDGMINTVKTLQITAKLPLSTLLAMQKMDVGNIYKEKSFSANLQETIVKSASYDEYEAKEAELYMPFWYALVAIGCYKDKPYDALEVIECVKTFIDSMMHIVTSDEEYEEDNEEISEGELAEYMGECIEEMLADEEMVNMLELQCGVGARTYIINAVNEYAKMLKKGDN